MDVFEQIFQAISSVNVPTRYDRVFNDECIFSFDTPESATGLYTSLSTWKSFGEPFVGFDFEKNGNPIYLKQVWKRLVKEQSESAKDKQSVDNSKDGNEAPSKMAIGVDGGFQFDSKKYDKHVENFIVVFPSRQEIPFPNDKLPEKVKEAAQAILDHDGFQRSAAVEAAAWEEDERKESKYAKDLVQLSSQGKKISPDPKTWVCEESGMTENLWLNLSTGHIGSGRRNWDGSGGTGAAKKHFEETGKKYPLAVKLGTITPQGADVFSYADDEDDMVVDPYLSQHLAHWGINMQLQEKSEKTVTELQIEFNSNYNFSKITESGSDLVPLHGPGYVGLENLGNSCYMSSVMQIMFSVPQIAYRYTNRSKQIFESAPADPTQDLISMMAKLSMGLLTDRYTKPVKLYEKDEINEGKIRLSSKKIEDEEYGNIKPMMFKSVIGKGHSEFSSGRQQDASEFYQHFLDRITRAEHGGKQRLLSDGDSAEEFVPTAALFQFELEDRIEDSQTSKVKYVTRSDNLLSLTIDMNDAVNKKQYDDFEEQSKKRTKYDEGVEEVRVTLDIPLDICLQRFAQPELIENFMSPETGQRGKALKRTRFKTFPEYLTVHLKRYYIGENWVPKKLDATIAMPSQLDLEFLRAKGPQPDEQMMRDDEEPVAAASSNSDSNASAANNTPAVVPDHGIVSQLMDMGFSENGSKRAAIATNNSSAQASMEWVFQHMTDSDFNDPIEQSQPTSVSSAPQASAQTAKSSEFPPEAMMTLTSLGFTETQAKGALTAVEGSVERAADWLFSHADGLDAAVKQVLDDAEQQQSVVNSEPASGVKFLDGDATYELLGFASHLGSNTSCGHYVAHIRKDGRFVLFNDAKVAESKRAPTDLGFLYVYKRIH